MPPRRNRAQKQGGPKKTVQGVISINRRGTGYGSWPESEVTGKKLEQRDIEVANDYLNGALNGDEVEVEIKGLFPRPQGAVVGVIKRAKEQFVATIKREGRQFVGIAADVRFYKPIEIKNGDEFN